MTRFSRAIRPYVLAELDKAKQAADNRDASGAFRHLENAHVLGQESTYWHVVVHWLMLIWGIRQRNGREVVGQLIRIVGAAALTAIKGVPIGNTGGSNVSPIKPLPVSSEHAAIIAEAKGMQN